MQPALLPARLHGHTSSTHTHTTNTCHPPNPPSAQVSIDDPPIVLAFMAASLALFWLAFGGSELAVTAAAAYYSMGLVYEFT